MLVSGIVISPAGDVVASRMEAVPVPLLVPLLVPGMVMDGDVPANTVTRWLRPVRFPPIRAGRVGPP